MAWMSKKLNKGEKKIARNATIDAFNRHKARQLQKQVQQMTTL